MPDIICDSKISSYLWDYSISFISEKPEILEYYHHCYKIVISLDKSFELAIDGQTFSGIRGFIINQDIPHSYSSQGLSVLVSFIEVNSSWGWKLRNLLLDKSWININTVLTAKECSQILPANHREISNSILIPYVKTFLNSFFALMLPAHSICADVRIRKALNFIEKNLHRPLELDDLSEHINLSPERIRHLFVEQMHIPFTQYVLWKRIRKTVELVIREESKIVEACHRFGFTDQPHFNKSFKRIFGLTPMVVIRNCRILL